MDYYSANDSAILTKPKNVISRGNVCIHPTACIHPEAIVGPNVTIGKYVKIGEGARVKDSILLDDITVGPHTVIINTIVGWGTIIGSWTRIEGILKSGEKTNKTLQEQEFEGYYHNTKTDSQQEVQRLIKNGVTIIGAGSEIASEIHVRNCVVLPSKKILKSTYH